MKESCFFVFLFIFFFVDPLSIYVDVDAVDDVVDTSVNLCFCSILFHFSMFSFCSFAFSICYFFVATFPVIAAAAAPM